MDLTGPKETDALDRCLTNTMCPSCTDACNDADVPGCEVIDDLQGGASDPVDCDRSCAAG